MYKSRKMFPVKIATLAALILLFALLKLSSVAQATTQVGGTISQNTTWTLANSPYVVTSNVTVNAGVKLTIEPGVVVKFQSQLSLTVNGTLEAQGTSTDKIVFTSIKDDSYAGDTNGDGSATTPAKGDWSQISFTSSSTNSIIDNSIVKYGGYVTSGKYGVISVLSPSLTLTNTTIDTNNSYAVYAGTNTTLAKSGNSASNNSRNGVYVQSGTTSAATRWQGADLPYVISYFTIGQNNMHIIDPGTIIKFEALTYLTIDGAFSAVGTPDQKIVFTSIKDDSVGGDTNNDATITVPAKADWAYIKFSASSVNSVLNQAIIKYGSWNSWTPLLVYINSLTLTNNQFSDNDGYAIAAGTNVTLNVSGNTATNNKYNGIATFAGGTEPTTISSPVTWRAHDLPYVVNASLTIGTTTLTIEPGIVVKFKDPSLNLTVNGTLVADGIPTDKIIFTSFKDDSVGGDTNGDANLTSPAKGDWAYIK